MKPWNETGIGIVFLGGLILAAIAGITVLFFIRPAKKPIEKITGNMGWSWAWIMFTTVIMAALAGAMSVSFRDCGGDYKDLMESRAATVMKGLEQVSESFNYMAIILGTWLLIFLALFIFLRRNPH
jgi:heme/copper-type cytochrome/quinol oxidase subunit 2